MCDKIEGSHDKIITTIALRGENITRLSPLALLLVLQTRNDTDSNKLVISMLVHHVLVQSAVQRQ